MSDQAEANAAPSRKGAIKVVATVLGIGAAVTLLLTASISSGSQYYKFVDEVVSNTDGFRGKKLKVHGIVADG
jgi:cytochrome c-type biogenesis protein CcmE